MPTTVEQPFHTPAPDLARPRGSSTVERQGACLVESALRILRDHVRDGDRYLRAATRRLIEVDAQRLGVVA